MWFNQNHVLLMLTGQLVTSCSYLSESGEIYQQIEPTKLNNGLECYDVNYSWLSNWIGRMRNVVELQSNKQTIRRHRLRERSNSSYSNGAKWFQIV